MRRREPVVVTEFHPEQRGRGGAEIDALVTQDRAAHDGRDDAGRTDQAGTAGDPAERALEAVTSDDGGRIDHRRIVWPRVATN